VPEYRGSEGEGLNNCLPPAIEFCVHVVAQIMSDRLFITPDVIGRIVRIYVDIPTNFLINRLYYLLPQ
jgi:hypothetical protein